MRSIVILIACALFLAALPAAAQQQEGQPLYFEKGEVGEHPSDLAPEGDPGFHEEVKRRQQRGESLDDLYDEPTESYYEESVRYERVDKNKKRHKQPRRWE